MDLKTPPRGRRSFILLTVLQAILLVGSLALAVPAAVLAQDEEPPATAAAEVSPDGGGSPEGSAADEGSSEGGQPQADAGGDPPDGDSPKADAGGDPPGGGEPKGDQPNADEPKGDQPGSDEPSGDQPSGDGPSGDGPNGDEPSGDEPSGDEPSGDQPSGDGPSGDGAAPEATDLTTEPQGDEPSGDRPDQDQAGTQAIGPAATDNHNDPVYWQEQGYGQCWKHTYDPSDPTKPGDHGSFTGGGTTFRMGTPPADRYFSLLVIKAGSSSSSPNPELVFEDPNPGQTYGPVVHNDGHALEISHVIVCKHYYGTLIVKKVVVNDDGGTLSSGDFTIHVKQNGSDISGSPQPGSVTGSSYGKLKHGSFVVSEEPETGYIGTISGDCDASGNVTVGAGETKVCIITNHDDAPTLTLVKRVVGGWAEPSDFQGLIDAVAVDWETPTAVVPGGHTASEISLPDYVALAWGGDCAEDGSVSIGLGEHKTCTITNKFAQLSIVKKARPAWFTAVGEVIEYTITATNTGKATLHGVDVSDALIDGLGSWTCQPAIPATLASDESIVCTASYTISEADMAAGSVPNTACAVSDETPTEVCDSEFVQRVSILVDKTADDDVVPATGQDVLFTFTVTNTSVVALAIISLEDDVFGTLAGDDDCEVGTVLQPGASCTFQETHRIKTDEQPDPGEAYTPHVNTFTARGEPAEERGKGPCVCDSDDQVIDFSGGGGSGSGGGGGGAGNLPPTDTSVGTAAQLVPAGQEPILWPILALAAGALILLVGWTFRRERVRRD